MHVDARETTTYVYARPFFFNPATSETKVDTVDKQPVNPIRTPRIVPMIQNLSRKRRKRRRRKVST